MASVKMSHEEMLRAYYEEKVPVYITRPEGEPENSITVTHNGTNYQIMYDEDVMVPRKVAMIIDEHKRNKRRADAVIRGREGNRPLGE